MTGAIKAIETRYAGCRFRSRLEARWAVFFDQLQIKWEYEPQGYVVDGTPYLPDFWLPESATWVEVKGHMTADQFATLANAALPSGLPARPHSDEAISPVEYTPRVLILGKIPNPNGTWLHMRLDLAGDRLMASMVMFAAMSANDGPRHYRTDVIGQPAVAHLTDAPSVKALELATAGKLFPFVTYPSVTAAYGSARIARFEHGECP